MTSPLPQVFMRAMLTAVLICLALVASTLDTARPTDSTAAVNPVLDDWHRAVAQADEARYFSHFTPDAILLGTDVTERWTRDEFRAWAKPFFTRGKAWSFASVSRKSSFSKEGTVAWFDEALSTPNMGPHRDTGVLVKAGDTWKIAQCNLSVPILNDLLKEFKERIELFEKERAQEGKGQ